MTTGRALAVLGLSALLLAGCAQPGQLGSPLPPPAPEAVAVPAPVVTPTPTPQPPPGPALLGSGRVPDRVRIQTPGPAEFSVRTEVLAPGATSGWHRHPGTETTIVTAGAITVLTADDCDGTRYADGAALFVPDAEPHLTRNDGTVPVELVVTYLLAPDADDRGTAPDPC